MLNALSKEANVTSSLKKFFVDALGAIVTFDISLAAPDIRSQGPSVVKQWYNVNFGPFGRQALAEYDFEVFCLSRQDPEGALLAESADTIIGLLIDSDKTDGMKRIPLYDTEESPWVQIGSMVVQEIWDAPVLDKIKDETKIKILSVKLRWGAAL
jgi:hypothetical protein